MGLNPVDLIEIAAILLLAFFVYKLNGRMRVAETGLKDALGELNTLRKAMI